MFQLTENTPTEYNGSCGNASYTWLLPGIICPACKTTWGAGSKSYPSVDLTPVEALADFKTPRPEPAEEYERLRELVRPLLPPGALVEPGSAFGPLRGPARGRFPPLSFPFGWWLLLDRETLEGLQAEGVRGLKACRTALSFRQRNPPELLELELLPVGRLHPDCLPPERPAPCARCGRRGLPLPKERVLDASTLPLDVDVFRLADFSTVVICSERFIQACRRLGLNGVAFTPLPIR